MRIVGVNAENCPHFYDSLRRGEPTPSAYRPTLADGIAAPFTPLQGNFELVKEVIDDVVLVSEEEIARAIRLLAVENKLVVVEGAGAVSLAAAYSAPKSQRGRTVCILSGGRLMWQSWHTY